MNFFKNIWNKIKSPHGIWLILFYIFFVVAVAGTLVLVILIPEQTIWHYILYPVAGLSLTYFVYTMVIFMPRMKNGIIKLLRKFKFTSKILDDYGYRTVVFSVCSFIFNLAYISFIGVFAIMSRTAWYMSITIYYIILALMKGNVFYSQQKHGTKEKEAKALRFSGIMFVLLTLIFSVVILLIYKFNRYFEYAGLLIYAVAAFTFYKLTLAICNIFKARKHNSLYVQNITFINLATAIISIIILQVAMFQAFSPESNSSIANALTGAGASVIILTMGIIMIIKAQKRLKELKQDNK